jgi:hypothetical protein
MAEKPKRNSSGRTRRVVTNGRVDAPAGKTQWMDKDTHEITSGRVDAPIGKEQWMDEDSSAVVSRPGQGQVVRPTTPGKPVRPSNSTLVRPSNSRPVLPDTTSAEVRYELRVENPGDRAEEVRDLVKGESRLFNEDQLGEMGALFLKLEDLGAKAVVVNKLFTLRNTVSGLKKGDKVEDYDSLKATYVITVNDLGDDRDRVLDLLLGESRLQNLEISLPAVIEFEDNQKDEALGLAQKLVDAGAGIEITRQVFAGFRIG